MTDGPKDDFPEQSMDAELTRARELILKRRARLMAAAVASLGVLNTNCSKTGVCLSMADPTIDAGSLDAGSSVCLSPVEPDAGLDAGPTVCLDFAFDSGPSVCLGAPYEDAGQDAEPSDGGVADASTDGAVSDAGDPLDAS
jgi:hypothetical protein